MCKSVEKDIIVDIISNFSAIFHRRRQMAEQPEEGHQQDNSQLIRNTFEMKMRNGFNMNISIFFV